MKCLKRKEGTFNNLIRIFQIIFDLNKSVILLIIIRNILNAMIPFGAIIVSGNVIDQMVNHRNYEETILFALFGCFIVFVVYLLQNLLHKFCEVKNKCACGSMTR